MSTAAVGKLLAQLDEFQAQRLDAGDESVQRSPVGRPSHQHRAGGDVGGLERLQSGLQGRCQPALDPEGVVSVHDELPSAKVSQCLRIEASG